MNAVAIVFITLVSYTASICMTKGVLGYSNRYCSDHCCTAVYYDRPHSCTHAVANSGSTTINYDRIPYAIIGTLFLISTALSCIVAVHVVTNARTMPIPNKPSVVYIIPSRSARSEGLQTNDGHSNIGFPTEAATQPPPYKQAATQPPPYIQAATQPPLYIQAAQKCHPT